MARGTIRCRTLQSTKNGRPEVRYVIRYDLGLRWDAEKERYQRKQKEETVPPPHTRKHAEKVLAERLAQINRGDFVEPSSMLFREFTDRWLEICTAGDLKPGTIADYKGYCRTHLLPAFGDKPLSQISVEDVQSFKAGKIADGYSPFMVRCLLSLMRQMLSRAVDWDYLRDNPARKVKDPPAPKREMDCLTSNEARAFLDAVPNRWYPFFLTAITTGLRIGELLAMRWGNLDRKSGRYFVKETLSRPRYEYKGGFTTPKTEGSGQPVDLTPSCLQTLEQHHKRQAEEKLKAGADYDDQDLIFATPNGTPLDHRNIVRRQFHSSLEAAGLRRIRLHELRHTCASLLINDGVSPKSIQRQMRHSSIKMTLDTYGHLFPETNAEVTRRMDGILLGAASSMASTGR